MKGDAEQGKKHARGDVSPSQVLEWVMGLDRQEVASKTTWTPDTLWARWRRYCQMQDEKDPPEPAVMSGFCLFVGLSTADLEVFTEKGPQWARVTKRIELECIERVERRLIRGQGSAVGCIFWLKNRAGFRDKTPDEAADDREDWLTRIQTAAAVTQGQPTEVGARVAPGNDDLLELDAESPGVFRADLQDVQRQAAGE
jgi:hypothetical protein